MIRANFCIFLLLAACVCHAQEAPSTTVRVDVKLVNVFVTVTDAHGAPIGSLKQNDFKLSEDGKEQKISVFDKESALPLSIVLAIDTSLSTRRDLPLELASARRFAHTVLRPQDGIALFQFSEIVNEVLPFTSQLKSLDRAIERLHPGSATALYDALFLGSQALDKRQGRKVMVVITDAETPPVRSTIRMQCDRRKRRKRLCTALSLCRWKRVRGATQAASMRWCRSPRTLAVSIITRVRSHSSTTLSSRSAMS